MVTNIKHILIKNGVSLSEKELNILEDIIGFFSNKTSLIIDLGEQIEKLGEFLYEEPDLNYRKIIIAKEVSSLIHNRSSKSSIKIGDILKSVKSEKGPLNANEEITIIIHILLREYVNEIDTILKIGKSVKEFGESF